MNKLKLLQVFSSMLDEMENAKMVPIFIAFHKPDKTGGAIIPFSDLTPDDIRTFSAQIAAQLEPSEIT